MQTDDTQFRQFARAGALAMCLRAITEFPDILAELNAHAKPVRRADDAVPAPRKRPAKRAWSKAARQAQAARMKARWAAKRKGGK